MTETPPTTETLSRLALALGQKYEVRQLVGRGGFAEVYEVWDRSLERRLAVKVLRPDVAWTSGMLERFKQETRAVARLEHSNILTIHFVGEGDGGRIVYYAMPFVEGQSLGDLLRRSGALPYERALAIAEPILDALQHAHDAGLLHRDIKPDNIMLDVARGRPLLVDFGIARRLDDEAGLTQAGLVVGTPHYMSPEQALGDRNLDGRSDLYAMGAVLFQMVTGSPPFDGESSQEIVGRHIAEPPPAAREVEPSVPAWLSEIITRCLAKKPADRYQSAADVLHAIADGRAPERPPTRTRSTARGLGTLSANAKTELVQSGTRRRSGAATMPTAMARRPRRLHRWLTFGAMAVALVAGGTWFFIPRLEFTNRLPLPVAVTAGGVERVVEPGDRLSVRLGDGPRTVTWAIVPPRSSDGAPLGALVSDTVMAFDVRRVRVVASARPGDRAYFAPLITNQTGRPLRVILNSGLQGAVECPCTVPLGAVRMTIGYYALFANSTVHVVDERGRGATFENLGAEVDRETGTVGLVFRAEDLR